MEAIDGRTGTYEGRIVATTALLRRVRPDVVVPLGLAHVARAVGREKARGASVRLVLPLHALSPEMLGEAMALEGVTDLCVGVNRRQERVLRLEGFKAPLLTIENGAPPAQPRPARPADVTEPIRLLFVGRFEQATKRVSDAVDLATELGRRGVRFRMTMVGDGPAKGLLESRIREEGFGESVELRGYIPRPRLLADVMPAADLLMLFSSTEAGPLVPLEGMSRGVVPVVASFPGLGDLSWFRDGVTACSFPCGDVTKAANAIEKLAADRETLEAMSLAALRTAEQLSWRRCGEAWVEAVEEVFSRPLVLSQTGYWEANVPVAAGRLERAGLPGRAADWIRRAFRRYPDFIDGWGEWPGTLVTLKPEARERLRESLLREVH